MTSEQVDEFFAGSPLGRAVFDRVVELLAATPGCSVAHWMHHPEIAEVTDVDDEVAGWLSEAADRAG